MSKETAEEYLTATAPREPDYGGSEWVTVGQARHYGDLRAQEERDRTKAQCERDGCYQYLSVDQIRQEERERVLAEFENAQSTILRQTLYEKAKAKLPEEWRAQDVEEWLRGWCEHPKDHEHEVIRFMCERCRGEALARARAQGAADEHEKIMADWRSTDPSVQRAENIWDGHCFVHDVPRPCAACKANG